MILRSVYRTGLLKLPGPKFHSQIKYLTCGCPNIKGRELSSSMKIAMERHWGEHVNKGTFNADSDKEKFYVLSMFPYPSGHLHMGHVRVYSISDCMARYHRLHGKNVLQPMGWDAFGLPAENAAIQRNIPAADWTRDNISHMKEQLQSLGTSFDWHCELATCYPEYYRWTQELFIKLFEHGMAYQKEAMVNWDPVDNTVLAEEQVDANGRSWRSGAKVEKRLLRQWFIKTTKFAKPLYDGLSELNAEDWKDIIKVQKHWIGDCDGWSFDLEITGGDVPAPIRALSVWTQSPEYLLGDGCFVALKSTHLLNVSKGNDEMSKFKLSNPFTGQQIPIIITDNVLFPMGRSGSTSEIYLGVADLHEDDLKILEKYQLPRAGGGKESKRKWTEADRQAVLDKAIELNIGGYPISSKLQDWLISRQRYWGTPIPIIYCSASCGAVPDTNLPILLDSLKSPETTCPNCGAPARRETDTMDTFVDSSWYFLRYLDSKNEAEMFSPGEAHKMMPVDLYIGGKEHAELHLYYARFINHFLHSLGLVPQAEPFKRLLVQGMVMGRSFRVKETGKYVSESEIEIIDLKKNKAIEKATNKHVVVTWEKMSKSKFNGVDPAQIINEYGCDTTRLFILGNVAPMSHRNWTTDTFPGILNWQKRIWLIIHELLDARARDFNIEKSEKFADQERILWDAKNYYLSGATFNFRYTQHISSAISNMQGLTNFIRRAPKDVVKHGAEFEAAIAAQLVMLAPLAPHFASECWYRLASAPDKANSTRRGIDWSLDVLEQKWPEVDMDYKLDLTVYVNGAEKKVLKVCRSDLDTMSDELVVQMALSDEDVMKAVGSKVIKHTRVKSYPGCQTDLSITVARPRKDNN